MKYLSHCKRSGKECVLKAVLLVSMIWDMYHTSISLRKFVNRHTLVRYLTYKFTLMLKE